MSTVDTLSGNGMDDLKELQQRLNYESIKHQFRPKLIGGLNEDDVSQYIEYIEDKFHKLEQENKKYMDLNYNLKKQLEAQMEENMCLQENMDDAKQKMDVFIAENKNKDALVKTMNENFSLEREEFQNEILKFKEGREELEGVLAEARFSIAESEEYKAALEENNSQLNARINCLEKENEEIEILKGSINSLTEEKTELGKILSEARFTIAEHEEYKTRLEENNNQLKARIDCLEKENEEIEILNDSINSLTEEKTELGKMLSEARFAIAEYEEYTANLEENNSQLKARIDCLEKENEEIEILKGDIIRLTEENEVLEKMLSEVSLTIDQVHEYEARQKELENQLADLEPELEKSMAYAANLEESSRIMTAKIAELENKAASMENDNAQMNKLCQELKSQLEAEKTKNENQIMYLEMSKQKITSLEATVKESMTELEEQRKISDRAEQELQLEKAKASSSKINGFKEELESIYKKIEILENEAAQHVRNINELQQQLSMEQNRANKAENNLYAYTKLVSDFKEKYEKEQNMIETQYRNFLNNRSQLHSEIRDLAEINTIEI